MFTDFTLKYILGIKIEKTNELSKRLDQKVGVENDNENKKTNRIRIDLKTSKSSSKKTRSKYIRKIKKAREKNNKVVGVVEKIRYMYQRMKS